MPATFETLWDAVVEEIKSLDLAELPDDKIRQQQLPYNPANGEIHEGCFVCPATEREGPNGTNTSTDVGYGFSVTLILASNSHLGKTAQQTLLDWREKIRQHFQYASPLRDEGSYTCSVEFAGVVLPGAWKLQYDASALIVRCWVLE